MLGASTARKRLAEYERIPGRKNQQMGMATMVISSNGVQQNAENEVSRERWKDLRLPRPLVYRKYAVSQRRRTYAPAQTKTQQKRQTREPIYGRIPKKEIVELEQNSPILEDDLEEDDPDRKCRERPKDACEKESLEVPAKVRSRSLLDFEDDPILDVGYEDHHLIEKYQSPSNSEQSGGLLGTFLEDGIVDPIEARDKEDKILVAQKTLIEQDGHPGNDNVARKPGLPFGTITARLFLKVCEEIGRQFFEDAPHLDTILLIITYIYLVRINSDESDWNANNLLLLLHLAVEIEEEGLEELVVYIEEHYWKLHKFTLPTADILNRRRNILLRRLDYRVWVRPEEIPKAMRNFMHRHWIFGLTRSLLLPEPRPAEEILLSLALKEIPTNK